MRVKEIKEMSTTYLYCRISTGKQSIERQIRNAKAVYPNGVVVQDAYTGTKIDRPEWSMLVRTVKSGDIIVFDSVSRMSRSAEEGFSTYQELYNKGVSLVFLKEPHINSDTYKKALEDNLSMTGTVVDYILDGINKYLLAIAKEQIRLAFEQSQKEVSDLHQRTKEGLITARLNGKQIGRASGTKVETKKSKSSKEIILKHSKDFNGTLDDAEVIKLIGLSRNTYYKYKKQLRES